MKISLLTVILFTISFSAKATNYYFSQTGNDAAGCTIGSPCRTLSKANSIVHPGDILNFKRGDTFFGTYSANVANVTLQGYSTGSNPVFSGFNTLTGWTNQGDGTWSVVDASLPSAAITMVTLDGAQMRMGRTPRASYLAYSSYSGDVSITSVTTPPSYNGTATQLVFKKNKYTLDRYPVSSVSGNTITYSGGGGTTDKSQGAGYFFQNSPRFCVMFGDWCYEPSLHKLTMYFGTDPSAYTIKVATTSYGINSNGANVHVNGIDFTGQSGFGFRSANASNQLVENCKFNLEGNSGVNCYQSINFILQNCMFLDCNNCAWEFDKATNCNILNNIVKRMGLIPGMGQSLDQNTEGSYEGGTVFNGTSTNTLIQGNSIDSCGYNGIRYSGSGTVHNNSVNHACLILSDGANYYHHGNSDGSTQGVINVTNNVGLYSPGNAEGTVDGQPLGVIYYSDDGSADMNYIDNTGGFASQDIFYIHNSQRIVIQRNLAYGALRAGIEMAHDGILLSGLIRNITITSNQIITTKSTQYNILFQSRASNTTAADLTNWGTAGSNLYATTSATLAGFRYVLSVTPPGSATKDLAGWKTATGKDASSTFTNVIPASMFVTNPPANSIPLTSNYTDLAGTSYPAGTLTLGAYTGKFLIQSSAPVSPPVISYATPQMYTVSAPITPLTPTQAGGAPLSYSVVPALPVGLTLNTTSGVVSGTPTSQATTADYTITATNAGGSGHTVLRITVNSARPNISYVSPQTYPVGTGFTLGVTNTGGSVSAWAVSPATENGITFNTSTGQFSGTPIAPASAVNYRVIATGTGADTAFLSLTVADIAPSVTYTPNSYTLIKGYAFSNITPVSSGGHVVSWSISPALTSGLVFSTSTGVVSGTATSTSNPRTYTVVAHNAIGTSTTHLTLGVVAVAYGLPLPCCRVVRVN